MKLSPIFVRKATTALIVMWVVYALGKTEANAPICDDGCDESASNLARFSSGNLDALTGAPNEFTCGFTITCHFGNDLNDSGGSMKIIGPDQYMPGQIYDISVDLERVGQSRWGFMLTVLDTLNNSAGQLILTDSVRTQLGAAIERTYVKHTSLGTDFATPDTAPGWSFQWMAPAEPIGLITMYAAGNAANSSGDPTGDFIYSVTLPMAQGMQTSVDNDHGTILPRDFKLYQNFPNPFNPSTQIQFNLPVTTVWSLSIYNINGQLIEYFRGSDNPGLKTVQWDATEFSSGMYFYKFSAGDFRASRKMTLLK